MPKLNPTQQAILGLCKTGKTWEVIAMDLGCSQSTVYNNLGILQRLGYIKRLDRHRGRLAVFVSLVDAADIPEDLPEPVAPQSDLSMLVSRAHDPFNLTGGTHGIRNR